MAKALLSLCQLPKALNRDGYSAPNANVLLPFEGRVFADGRELTFVGDTTEQDRSKTLSGTTRVNTFKKDCCHSA